ncbi:MAG: divalent cation tolerance protein CutA [Dehalococcoidia bacterium]|nr:divalent cation tolerance protein CutA [Dehalococcoidia bacterium]
MGEREFERGAGAIAELKVSLTHRKAACVNIVPRINSFFSWHGNLDSAQESLLIVKAKASN